MVFNWTVPKDFRSFQTDSLSPVPPYHVMVINRHKEEIFEFTTPLGVRLEQLVHHMAEEANVPFDNVRLTFEPDGSGAVALVMTTEPEEILFVFQGTFINS